MANLPEDQTGTYPYTEYRGRKNTNQAALGEKRNDLKFFSQSEEIELPIASSVSSEYGLNQVQQSAAGHSFEIDDTEGNRRILILHADGIGIELTNDGSVIVSSKTKRVEVCGGTQEVIVEGDATLHYKGNLNLKVEGQFNVECMEYNVKVENDKNETVFGAVTTDIGKGVTRTVVGSVAEYITENKVTTVLGSEKHYIKAGYDVAVEASINMSSKDDLFLTAADTMNFASDNGNLSANNLTVQGGSGVIGGTSMLFSGKGAVFEEGVTAPTFHGDLNGLAKLASEADAITFAHTSTGTETGTASWSDGTNKTDTPTIAKPTASKVTDYLSTRAGGIKNIIIDQDDNLKNYLDQKSDYGGILV